LSGHCFCVAGMRVHGLATRRVRALRFRCAGSVGFVVGEGKVWEDRVLGLLGGGEVYKMRCRWTAFLVGKLLPFLLTDYLSIGLSLVFFSGLLCSLQRSYYSRHLSRWLDGFLLARVVGLRCIGDSGWRQGLQHGLYALKSQELGVVWCIVLIIQMNKHAYVTGN
jgi:hypothetical protein